MFMSFTQKLQSFVINPHLIKRTTSCVKPFSTLLIPSSSITSQYHNKFYHNHILLIQKRNHAYRKKVSNNVNYRKQKVNKSISKTSNEENEETEEKEDNEDTIAEEYPSLKGLVLERHGEKLLVEILPHQENDKEEYPRNFSCLQKTKLTTNLIVAGDLVEFSVINPQASLGRVHTLYERLSLLTRPSATSNYNKVTLKNIASNIDQLFIVIALQPMVPLHTIDQCIVAAHDCDIPHIHLVINKCDLEGTKDWRKELSYYEDLGYTIHLVSCETGKGIESLRNQLINHTSIFVGQSGVGKSSLINQFLPHEDIRVGELVSNERYGAHTTSNARLYHLSLPKSHPQANNMTSYIIDSPGIREMGIWHLPSTTILDGFKEIAKYAKQCKFTNCEHETKDLAYCEVQKAIQQGKIHPQRLLNYQNLLKPRF